jgi:hypothetical protein
VEFRVEEAVRQPGDYTNSLKQAGPVFFHNG